MPASGENAGCERDCKLTFQTWFVTLRERNRGYGAHSMHFFPLIVDRIVRILRLLDRTEESPAHAES